MQWWAYVTRVAGSDQQKAIATRAHVDQSTVSRWKTTGRPGDPDKVAAFARAYGRPVLEAFIEAGFLTDEEARAQVVRSDVSRLADDELLGEVTRRMAARFAGVDAVGVDEEGHYVTIQMKTTRNSSRQLSPEELQRALAEALAAVGARPLRELPPLGPLRELPPDDSPVRSVAEQARNPPPDLLQPGKQSHESKT